MSSDFDEGGALLQGVSFFTGWLYVSLLSLSIYPQVSNDVVCRMI
jgi:hypothetical protein